MENDGTSWRIENVRSWLEVDSIPPLDLMESSNDSVQSDITESNPAQSRELDLDLESVVEPILKSIIDSAVDQCENFSEADFIVSQIVEDIVSKSVGMPDDENIEVLSIRDIMEDILTNQVELSNSFQPQIESVSTIDGSNNIADDEEEDLSDSNDGFPTIDRVYSETLEEFLKSSLAGDDSESFQKEFFNIGETCQDDGGAEQSSATVFLPSSSKHSIEKKVAKVMPYAGPQEEIFLSDDDEPMVDETAQQVNPVNGESEEVVSRIVELVDEMETDQMAPEGTTDSNPGEDSATRPSSSGLRLKSFATLMASPTAKEHSNVPQPKASESNENGTSSSWHMAPSDPPPTTTTNAKTGQVSNPQVKNCIKSSFAHAAEELEITYLVNLPESQQQRKYHIFTSTSVLFLKLFVREEMVQKLSKDPADWKEIFISFWPDQTNPTHVRILFVTGPKKELVAKLPANNEMTIEAISGSLQYFALSFLRVKDINATFFGTYTKPFISHAIKGKDTVMAVDLERKTTPFATTLFEHLETAGTIDQNVRQKTRGHIALCFHHHNITRLDASGLEQIIFKKCKNQIQTYKILIVKYVDMEVKRSSSNKQATQPTPQIQNQQISTLAPPSEVMQNVQFSNPVRPPPVPVQQLPSARQQVPFQQPSPVTHHLPIQQVPQARTVAPMRQTTGQPPTYAEAINNVITSEVLTPIITSVTSAPIAAAFVLNESGQVVRLPDVGQVATPQGLYRNVETQQASASMEFCMICGRSFFGKEMFLNHLTKNHFSVSVAKHLQPKTTACNFSGCTMTFQTSLDLLLHLGVQHEVALVYYNKVDTALTPFGKVDRAIFLCSFPNCPNNGLAMKLHSFLEHLLEAHYAASIGESLSIYQNVLGSGESRCPLNDCPIMFDQKIDLLKHYGIDHCLVIEHYIKNIKGSPAGNALEAYERAIGKEYISCKFKKANVVCGKSFGSETAWLHHMSIEHFYSQLCKHFVSSSSEVPLNNPSFATQNNESPRMCKTCKKIFQVDKGGLHLGVEHKVAKLLISPKSASIIAKTNSSNTQPSANNNVPGNLIPAMPPVVPQTIPNLLPQVVPQTIPNRLPPVVPQSIPNHLQPVGPQSFPSRLPPVVPQTIPNRLQPVGPQSFPNRLPQPQQVPPPVNAVEILQNRSRFPAPVVQNAGMPTAARFPYLTSQLKATPVQTVNQSPVLITNPVSVPTTSKTPVATQSRNPVSVLIPNQAPVPTSNPIQVQTAVHADNNSVSAKTTTQEGESSDWYYQCPDCAERFPNSPKTSENYCQHVVSSHLKYDFYKKMSKCLPTCPDCLKTFVGYSELAQHVLSSHQRYVTNFILVEHGAKYNPSKIFSEQPKEVEPDPLSAQILFDGYKAFCVERKIDPKKCDAGWINIFLNFTINNSKPKPSEMIKLIEIIGDYHAKLSSGQSICSSRVILNFRQKMESRMATENTEQSRTRRPSVDIITQSDSPTAQPAAAPVQAVLKAKPRNSPGPASMKMKNSMPKTTSQPSPATSQPLNKAFLETSILIPSASKPQSVHEQSGVEFTSQGLAAAAATQPPQQSSVAEKVTNRVDLSNPDCPLACFSCVLQFPTVSALLKHVATSHHEEKKIGCKFCQDCAFIVGATPNWSQTAEEALTLHCLSADHLFNRWFYLFPESRKHLNIKLREAQRDFSSSVHRCEACSKDVPKFKDHVSMKQHIDNALIIDSFVEYCDHRAICPIDCHEEDLIFYIDIIYPKTKHNKQNKLSINIHQVLMVLARIHEPIDGMDLSAVPVLEEHITELLSSMGTPKPLPHFICYICKFVSSGSVDDFLAHVDKEYHRSMMSARGTLGSGKKLRCEPCSISFKTHLALQLHCFAKSHLNSLWYYQNQTDSYKPKTDSGNKDPDSEYQGVSQKEVPVCFLCDEEKRAGPSHLITQEHREMVSAANQYLQFCAKIKLNPTNIDQSYLKSFLNMSFQSSESSPNDVRVMLKVLDYVHDPIDGIKLGTNPHFIWLCNNLQKLLSKNRGSKDSDDQSSNSSRPSSAGSASIANQKSSEKNSEMKSHHYSSLTKDEIDDVLRCPDCKLKFYHSTYLVYHVVHMHKKNPSQFLESYSQPKSLKTCPKCAKKCVSPMIMALHHDRHHLTKALECQNCHRNYISPSNYYKEDKCRKNSLPDSVKSRSDEAIKDFVLLNPATRIVGEKIVENQSKRKSTSDSENDSKKENSSSKIGRVATARRPIVTSSDSETEDTFGIAARNKNKKDFLIKYDQKLKSDVKIKISADDRIIAENFQKKNPSSVKSKAVVKEQKTKQEVKPLKMPVVNAEPSNHSVVEAQPKSSVIEPTKNSVVKEQPKHSVVKEKSKHSVVEVPTKQPSVELPPKQPSVELPPKQPLVELPPKQPLVELPPKQPLAEQHIEAAVEEPKKKVSGSKRETRSNSHVDLTNTLLNDTFRELKRKADPVLDELDSNDPKRARRESTRSNRSDTKTPVPNSSSANTPNPSSNTQNTLKLKTVSKPENGGGGFFCIDCEGCNAKSCDHVQHLRRQIVHDPASHCFATGHRRVVTISSTKLTKCRVRLPDLAYSESQGHRVRKQFKKFAKTVPESEVRWQFGRVKKCKIAGCKYGSTSVIDMFRHIRVIHLATNSGD